MDDALQKGKRALQKALTEYEPETVFGAFSGGTDSLVATHLLNRLRPDMKVLHINTNIGMQRTREYVYNTCDRNGWDLVEYKAKKQGHDYDEMVKGNVKGVPGGFPGPPLHTYYYRHLKERQIEQAHRDYKGEYGGKIMLATGIREDESFIRAGYGKEKIVQEHNGVVWVSLIYEMTAQDKQKYIDTFDLETNPVSDVYGMSGECLCGAFDENGGRLTELKACCHRFNEMETYDRIVSLQNEVWEEHPWRWDQRRPEWFERAKQGQLAFEGLPGADDNNRVAQRMCRGCGKGPSEQ